MRTELPAARVRNAVPLPLRGADGFATVATAYTFDRLVDGREHLALRLGDPEEPDAEVPLVRLHSECLTGDVLGSQRCDCGPQLRESIERLTAAGGYLLYLRQEGRGIGLYNKLDAYGLQDTGLDTYQANVALGHGPDERDYAVAAQMLLALGVEELSAAQQQPRQGRPARRRGADDRRAAPHRRTPLAGERRLPGRQGAPRRARPRGRLGACLLVPGLLRAALDARWRRCRRSKGAQPASAPAPCHRTPIATLATALDRETRPSDLTPSAR